MVNQTKIEEAVRLFLEGIGEDPDREGLKETPRRISEMCNELFGGMEQDASEHMSKVFTADNNEMVLEKDISFYSVCEHHFLPFYGKVHIAYVQDGKDVGVNSIDETATASANLFYSNSVSAPKMVSNDAMYKYYSTVMSARIMMVEKVASGEYSIEDAMARYEDEQGANVQAILDALNNK